MSNAGDKWVEYCHGSAGRAAHVSNMAGKEELPVKGDAKELSLILPIQLLGADS